MQIDKKLNDFLIFNYQDNRGSFEEFYRFIMEENKKRYIKDSEAKRILFNMMGVREFIEEWVSDSGGHKLIEPISSIATTIYTITQFYTFQNQNKTIDKLYRGITSKKSVIDRITKSKKIRTNWISSFTEEFNTAFRFGDYKAQAEEAGVIFSISNIESKNILMTQHDWLDYDFLTYVIKESQEEEEYVVINENNKTLDIKIEMVPYT